MIFLYSTLYDRVCAANGNICNVEDPCQAEIIISSSQEVLYFVHVSCPVKLFMNAFLLFRRRTWHFIGLLSLTGIVMKTLSGFRVVLVTLFFFDNSANETSVCRHFLDEEVVLSHFDSARLPLIVKYLFVLLVLVACLW